MLIPGPGWGLCLGGGVDASGADMQRGHLVKGGLSFRDVIVPYARARFFTGLRSTPTPSTSISITSPSFIGPTP